MSVTLYYIPRTEKNLLWYSEIAGRTLNEAQFAKILCPFWLDYQKTERTVRDYWNQ